VSVFATGRNSGRRKLDYDRIQRTLESWNRFDRLSGVAAVGAGKTLVATGAIQARFPVTGSAEDCFVASTESFLLTGAVELLSSSSKFGPIVLDLLFQWGKRVDC